MSSSYRKRKYRTLKKVFSDNCLGESGTNDITEIRKLVDDESTSEDISDKNDVNYGKKRKSDLNETVPDSETLRSTGNESGELCPLKVDESPVSCENIFDENSSSSSCSETLSENEEQMEIDAEDCLSEKIQSKGDLRTKLHVWSIKHRKNLTNRCMEDLLGVLRSEVSQKLPKSATTLIPSKCAAEFEIRTMMSGRGKMGCYVYLGIVKALQKIINPDIYIEKEINLLFHVDGMQVFDKSREQLWPILGKVLHKDYNSSPFVIAIFSGNSKPASVDDYLNDFVEEFNQLLHKGILINEKNYDVTVGGFMGDTPARNLVKKCKGHGGFHACERCETKGITVQNRRVYPEVNCKPRTYDSFRTQTQKEHHFGTTPLTKIINLDLIYHMYFDSMHLLFLGCMKCLVEQWLDKKIHLAKLDLNKRKILKTLLLETEKGVTLDFQRKQLDIKEQVNWKATQYRLLLLYCSALVLENVLEKSSYHHFMLLFVACRILCSTDLTVKHADYANSLLRQYFILLPTMYGKSSQIGNNHNLIHLADDVKTKQASLSSFSAFEFENCLGKLKGLIKGRKDIVPQIVKRLSEFEYCPQTNEDVKHAANNIIKKKKSCSSKSNEF